MMIYDKGELYIESDFPIRMLREEGPDMDLLIPLEDRTLNVFLGEMASYISDRLQFPTVKNILIRFSMLKGVNVCTIHLLRSIDLYTSIVNFEIDYTKHLISINNKKYAITFEIKPKSI